VVLSFKLFREFSPDLLSICIEHDRGYGRRRKRNRQSQHATATSTTPVDAADGVVASPFLQSITEEMSCLFDWEMDSSSAAMLEPSDVESVNTSSSVTTDNGMCNDDNDDDDDESYTATLVEGLRPKALKSRSSRRKKKTNKEQYPPQLQNLGYLSNLREWVAWVVCCVGCRERSSSSSRPSSSRLSAGEGAGVGVGHEDEGEFGVHDDMQPRTFFLDWRSIQAMYESMAAGDGSVSGAGSEQAPVGPAEATGLKLKVKWLSKTCP
jgi:hypothetical protein